MPQGDLLYLGHMLDVSVQAVEKIRGKDREDYEEDENLRLALTHLVQMIGKAARRVSPQSQQTYSQIPWSDVIGMRHKIVHDYLDVDFDVVWEVVTRDLPELISLLIPIVPPSPYS
ncbi:MAG TPA: HepT-like ribonuclease domain-containing protein [Thermoanaerobaculia bacterium]|nr:HepT-like ribonuclease domain-containing protein [Thermoanaerobaculia bacterium]